MVGVGKGAENNILIKDAESLEVGYRVNAVVLDKTGTITEGKPVVTDLDWTVSVDEQRRLQAILYTLETQSEHPLAAAVTAHLQGATSIALDSFESVTGQGVIGSYQNTIYAVGNQTLLANYQIVLPDPLAQQALKGQSQAKTVVFFARRGVDRRGVDKQGQTGEILAIIAIADPVKTRSKQAIDTLQRRGIEVYMLTGDNTQTAAAVANQVGIKHYKAETMPADKASFVKELQAGRQRSGDGGRWHQRFTGTGAGRRKYCHGTRLRHCYGRCAHDTHYVRSEQHTESPPTLKADSTRYPAEFVLGVHLQPDRYSIGGWRALSSLRLFAQSHDCRGRYGAEFGIVVSNSLRLRGMKF